MGSTLPLYPLGDHFFVYFCCFFIFFCCFFVFIFFFCFVSSPRDGGDCPPPVTPFTSTRNGKTPSGMFAGGAAAWFSL